MVDSAKIKGLMVEKGYSREQLADALGISINTMHRRLRDADWGVEEANELIELLGIENPSEIFFKKN